MKGAPRDRGAASWERSRLSTTVAEVCVDEGWEASGKLLVVVVIEASGGLLVVVVIVDAACG
jgi:hypothetical protein